MAFDEDDEKFDVIGWLKDRRNLGWLAGVLVGCTLAFIFEFYIIGYLINSWGFGALGRELATLDEFWSDDSKSDDTA